MTPKTAEVGDWICWLSHNHIRYGCVESIFQAQSPFSGNVYQTNSGRVLPEDILEVRQHPQEAREEE